MINYLTVLGCCDVLMDWLHCIQTIMEIKLLLLPYFQRNQAGSSPAMEFMGFKQCMDYLLGCGVLMTTFISDRHTTIASHMKKVLTKIVHYFDIWHLKKSKLLIKDYFGNV